MRYKITGRRYILLESALLAQEDVKGRNIQDMDPD